MKRLRVRGARAVQMAVLLKATGWNILAAARIQAHRACRVRRAAAASLAGGQSAGPTEKTSPWRRLNHLVRGVLRLRRLRSARTAPRRQNFGF